MTINMTNDSRADPPNGPPMANEPDWLAKLHELDPRLAEPHLWTYQTPSKEFYLTIRRARTTRLEEVQLHLVRESEDVIWLALIYNQEVTAKVLEAIFECNATESGEVPKAHIAHALAEAGKCPDTVLDSLALTGDRQTREIIAQRLDASPVARTWLRQHDGPDAGVLSTHDEVAGRSHELLFDPSDAAGERYLEHFEDQPTLTQELYAEHLAVDFQHTPDWVLKRVATKTTQLLVSRPGMESTNKNSKEKSKRRRRSKKDASLRDLTELTELAGLADKTDLKLLIDLGQRIARHPNASKDTLATLIDSREATVVKAAVANPKAPKHRFDDLAKCRLGREALASHASKGIANRAATLIELGEEAVLLALARNTHVRFEQLDRLLELETMEVVRSVASNPSTAPRQLESLLVHEDATVRVNAARNPSTDWEAIQGCVDRGDIHVISGSVNHPKAPEEHVLRYGAIVRAEDRRRLAGATTTPAQLLAALATDDDPEVRLAAAANPATPPDSLEHLYRHAPQAAVREAIICNPNCPEHLLRGALNVPSLHPHLASNPALPQEIQRELVGSSSEEVRLRLALNRNATPEVLARLAEDGADSADAVAAVLNPNYPLEEFDSYFDYVLVPRTVGAARLLAQVALRPAAKTIGELIDLFQREIHDSN